jgi:hypothetical protein
MMIYGFKSAPSPNPVRSDRLTPLPAGRRHRNGTQPNPTHHPSPMTNWIVDRLPTNADADKDGDVLVCTTPRLSLEDMEYEKWHDVTHGWPWRPTKYWTPPIPEPTPAAPEPELEPKPEPQLREDYTTCLNCYVVYKSSKSRCPNCGYGFVPEPEPEKATRGFLEFTRVRYQDGFIDCAIGTDHTAFIRFSAVRCFSEPDWVQVRPLPQPGEE